MGGDAYVGKGLGCVAICLWVPKAATAHATDKRDQLAVEVIGNRLNLSIPNAFAPLFSDHDLNDVLASRVVASCE